jgi:hypothetical protein
MFENRIEYIKNREKTKDLVVKDAAKRVADVVEELSVKTRVS